MVTNYLTSTRMEQAEVYVVAFARGRVVGRIRLAEYGDVDFAGSLQKAGYEAFELFVQPLTARELTFLDAIYETPGAEG